MTKPEFKANGFYVVNVAVLIEDDYKSIRTYIVDDKYDTEEELISALTSHYTVYADDNECILGYEIVAHITGVAPVAGAENMSFVGSELITD